MSIQVETKDCTAINDAELAEMADMCADGAALRHRIPVETARGVGAGDPRPRRHQAAGLLLLDPRADRGNALAAHRPGPVDRTARADTVLRAMMGDKYRRALLAFPDEDVLVGTRLVSAEGFRSLPGSPMCPRPRHKATGEERAWGRRLAKRFGCRGSHRRPDLRPGGRRVRVRGIRFRVPK